MLLLTLLGSWGGLAEAGHPCLDTPHRGSRGLFPTHDPSKTQKWLFKFNPHQSAPPQLFIYFRGCELAAPPKKQYFCGVIYCSYGIYQSIALNGRIRKIIIVWEVTMLSKIRASCTLLLGTWRGVRTGVYLCNYTCTNSEHEKYIPIHEEDAIWSSSSSAVPSISNNSTWTARDCSTWLGVTKDMRNGIRA